MHVRIGVIAAVVSLAMDLGAKWLIAAVVMNPPRVIPVMPSFNLVLGYNRGIAFGIFASELSIAPLLLTLAALAIVVFLTIWMWRTENPLEAIGSGAIIGGALGNVIDRLHDGAVTDFLDFYAGTYHWPAFNLADTAIFLGVLLVLFAPRLQRSGESSS